jgi:hypothetical protein
MVYSIPRDGVTILSPWGGVGNVPKGDTGNRKININQNGKQMSLLIIWLLVILFSKPSIFPLFPFKIQQLAVIV